MLSTPGLNPITKAKYDQKDPKSILAYAKLLVGKSLRQALPGVVFKKRKGKGGIGQDVEEYYFGLKPNNLSEPDFRKAGESGVELKTFGLIPSRRGYLASKERISLCMIDYAKLKNEEWETSSVLKKNSSLLLIAYRYPEIVGDYHDYIFKMADLWRFPEKDLVIMRKDWEAIREKIRSGRAGEISEGDSWYLGAATKGGKGSERRAFCLKQGYVSIIVARILGHKEAEEMESLLKNKRALHQGETVESYIKGQFKPYIGKSLDELGRLFKVSSKSKNFAANVTRYILKVSSDRIEEFEKAEITVKSIRIRKTGALDQEMSFPAFRFKDLVKENWDTSEFRQILTRRFFFVIYKQDMAGIFRLFGAMFWSMPEKILEGEVRRAWERAKAGVLKGDLSELPKISDDITAHVRPHGRRGVDVDELPNGTFETKRSFWLNKKYLARIILAEELEREFRNPETTL